MATNGSTAVNKPMDTKKKEEDVNRKLQLYGITSAFQSGKVPSNEQIDVALNSFLASKAIANPSKRLSAEGQALVADFRDVVQQAKNLLLSRNEGNLLQDFIWQTQQFDPKAVPAPNVPVDKQTAQQHGNDALQGLRTLGTLIITNGQFRKLLKDFTVLIRDIAGDAATNAAGRVRPSQDDLAQIDRPADDNVWHDAPDFSKDNLKKQAQDVYKGNPKEDVKSAAQQGVNSANQTGSSRPEDVAANRQAIDPQTGKEAAAGTLKNRLDQNVDDETRKATKETAQEYRRRTKEYLSKKVPQDRREQTIWRLKKMVLECQQHPDYQQAIETLLALAEEYGRHANSVTKEGTGSAQQARGAFGSAERDLKTLIERFANGTSSDDLFASIQQIYKDADRDPELKDWFKSMNHYVRRCLQEQGYIIDDASTHEWNRLYDQGRYLLREKYKVHTDRVVDEIKFLADQFDQDAQNKAFAASVKKLFTDLGNDQSGKPTFKPHLLKDLSEVIIPAIFENVAYIPVPRIEYSDPQIDAVVENLVLESDNFMPNVFEIASENFVRWGRKKVANKNKHAVEVKVSGVQLDLRDVAFYVKRKQGFPSITDQGTANIMMAGDGFSFKLKMSSAEKKDSQNFLKVDKVDVDVKKLKIQLTKSNHKLLFNLFKPVLLQVVRPAIQKAAEKAIKDYVDKADAMLFAVKQEADRALEEAQSDPENVPNIYSRYVSAVQKQILQGKQKAEAVAQDKKANVAVTKEDSIFPNISLPGGISTKATEYRDLARKGDKWDSPVFSIGSAKASTDVPSAPKIVRKPHTTSADTAAPGVAGTGLNGNSGVGAHNGGAFNPTAYDNGAYNGGAYNGNGYNGNVYNEKPLVV